MTEYTEATREACAVLERLLRALERIRDGEPQAPPKTTLEDLLDAVYGPFKDIF